MIRDSGTGAAVSPLKPSETEIDSRAAAHALVDRLPDLVFIIDSLGALRYANRPSLALLGRSLDEVIGINVLDLVDPDDHGLAVESLGETAAKGPGVREATVLRVRISKPGAAITEIRMLELVANNLLGDPDVDGILICARDVTDRPRLEAQIREMQRRFEIAFETAPFPRAVIGADGRFIRTNESCATLTGYSAEQLVGMHISELAHPDELTDEAQIARRLLDGSIEHDTAERRLRRADGGDVWVRRTFWTTTDAAGRPDFVHCSMTDVSERREAESRVRQLVEVLDSSTELVVFNDRHGKIEYVNARGQSLLGIHEGEEATEAQLERFFAPESLERVVSELIPAINAKGLWTGELTLRTVGGDDIPMTATIQAHHDARGEIALVSSIAHDIRELKDAQRLLQHQATHDALTALPNRQLFQELGEQALARADRDGTTVAVLFLDLDRFKQVNDSHGHPTGDELLVEVASRLRESVRRGDLVARFGGDEFVICCEHPAGRVEMLELAGRLIDALSRPADLGSVTAQVGVSIGIAIGAGPRVTIDTLQRDADVALYQAKEQGRGRAVIFGATAPAES